MRGQYDEAVANARRAVKLAPGSADGADLAGFVLARPAPLAPARLQNWYVLARNAEKGQIETFALSRFRRIEAAGSTFTRPADFDAQRYARQAFGITSGEKPIKMRLLFAPKDGVHQVGRVMKPAVGSAEIRELLGGAGPIIELVRCN